MSASHPTADRLLSTGELAAALGRSVRYVYAMRAAGFLMPGGRATLLEARAWLVRNPSPTGRRGKSISTQ